jgi:hypothetical protein
MTIVIQSPVFILNKKEKQEKRARGVTRVTAHCLALC